MVHINIQTFCSGSTGGAPQTTWYLFIYQKTPAPPTSPILMLLTMQENEHNLDRVAETATEATGDRDVESGYASNGDHDDSPQAHRTTTETMSSELREDNGAGVAEGAGVAATAAGSDVVV